MTDEGWRNTGGAPTGEGSVRRLALGSAQFGIDYGITNREGQVPAREVATMLDIARAAGMDTLDTAVAYGESEKVLGHAGVEGWRVITKVPPLPPERGDVANWIDEVVGGSLGRLGISQLAGLLLHRPSDLLGPHGRRLADALIGVRHAGGTEKIGVSIYDPDELDALRTCLPFDLVQAPMNVVDRRLLDSGWLPTLRNAGVEVHIRSVFLQGLLLAEPETRPMSVRHWDELWNAWDTWVADAGTSRIAACLGFVLTQPGVDRAVVGTASVGELRAIISSVQLPAAPVPATLASRDPRVIDPTQWRRQ